MTRSNLAGGWLRRASGGTILPAASVLVVVVAIWYLAAVLLNASLVVDRLERAGEPAPQIGKVIAATMELDRPLLPAPHQVAGELARGVFTVAVDSPRSLVYHGWVTFSAALVGFAIGGAAGILLAIAIVHVRSLEKSLLPWVVASQTVPILAIAPMVVVVLGSIGLVGLMPKALISAYLCFFPVTIGMVKGLKAPERIELDLMRTYSATPAQVLRHLRFPASLGFLFASMKVAFALAIVGAIVGELPTGAQAGLGARLLAGSYYGQTVQIWSALAGASFLSAAAIGLISLTQRVLLRRRGGAA